MKNESKWGRGMEPQELAYSSLVKVLWTRSHDVIMEPRHVAYWNFLYSFMWCKSLVRVKQQSQMHQLVVLSTRWVFSFDTKWGSSHFISFLCSPLCFIFLVFEHFLLGLDVTHNYLTHLPTYPHKYCINLGTLFIIPYWHNYPNNYLSYWPGYYTNYLPY
jgi:hypothetical protein